MTGDTNGSVKRLAARVLARNLERVAEGEFRKLRGSPAVQGQMERVRQAVAAAIADMDRNGVPDLEGNGEPPEPHYPNVAEFVDDFLMRHWRHHQDRANKWCAKWWLHEEAISRLEGLWQAWETLRLDGTTGIAVWWRDYADPTMAALTAEHGTFANCDTDHDEQTLWITEPPPRGLFRDRGHPEEQ